AACGRGKRWKPAVDLLETMRRQGLTPDAFSYSAAISACKNCERWEMALELLDDMRRRGLGKNLHSLNAAIAACASAGRWEPAMEILRGMETNGPKPDVFTYGSAIDAMAQGGKVDLALQTLRRMRASPSRYPSPNTVCYNVALKALTREGLWREARELLTEVSADSAGAGGGGEERVLDYLSYNSVIRACGAAGEVAEAVSTREEMRAAGIPADPYTYEALATACGLAGDWVAAEAMIREMLVARDHATTTTTTATDNEDDGETAAGGGSSAGGLARGGPGGKRGRGGAVGGGMGDEGVELAVGKQDTVAGEAVAGEGVGVGLGIERADEEPREQSWNQRLRQRRWRRKQLEDGVRPSPRVFHGLMEAYARAGEWSRALECLDDMARGAKGWLDGEEEEE
ncbi:unnamed protein product, partial [Laminaria digitata]